MPQNEYSKAVPTIRLEDAAFHSADLVVHYAHYPDGKSVSRLAASVAEFGRGEAYHVGMVDMTPHGTMVIEMVPPEGRCVPISERVNQHPATVHWLKVPSAVALDFSASGWPKIRCYDRLAAVHRMREYIGVRYGFDTIGRDYLASSWARWLTSMPANDEIVDWSPVCSTAALDAVQVGFGGWDLARNLNTACAQPEDVNRICIFQDMGALVP